MQLGSDPSGAAAADQREGAVFCVSLILSEGQSQPSTADR